MHGYENILYENTENKGGTCYIEIKNHLNINLTYRFSKTKYIITCGSILVYNKMDYLSNQQYYSSKFNGLTSLKNIQWKIFYSGNPWG